MKTNLWEPSGKGKNSSVTARAVIGLAQKALKSNARDIPTTQLSNRELDRTDVGEHSEPTASRMKQDVTGHGNKLTQDGQPAKQQDVSGRKTVGETRGGEDAEEEFGRAGQDKGKQRGDNAVAASSTK
ncbi:hypothetical protein PAXINDRAFT_15789 [Paxillus involutus ATCC 200175]|uniref:Uncharacterized protein n=1 Tax=Paxillus involutus ATCC 200175 TaxID=664439 RepID=A0A0C9TU34_PAXIN|nr:hypothetical protein PAXINDRAFT_15789 [Paxillus involutus ATCC 200175]